MNVLFISPYVPNMIRVRPYNFIRHLSKRGNRITLVTLWTDSEEKKSINDISKYCDQVFAYELRKVRSYWNCVKAVLSPAPLQSAYCWQPAAAHQLARKIHGDEYDVIHIEHMRGARYGLSLMDEMNGREYPPIIWDSVDSISHLFRQAASKSQTTFSRFITAFELGRTEAYESKLLRLFQHVLVTSQLDRDAFLALPGGDSLQSHISVVENGVDLNYFCPDKTIQRDERTLVVSGKLSYHANINMVLHLVHQIMPHVWDEMPDVKLVIVGKDPPPKITALSERPEIFVTGTVEDVRPYLRRAAIAVAPIVYGAGIQNKVLEAMACGTPVVSTSLAAKALSVYPGRDIQIEDDPRSFARTVLRLLNDPSARDEIGAAGREYVEKNHNWDTITSKLELIYKLAGKKFPAS